jgi:glyoxylase-like metal-dependent hydrolase (beta-lactamase superfamily II)
MARLLPRRTTVTICRYWSLSLRLAVQTSVLLSRISGALEKLTPKAAAKSVTNNLGGLALCGLWVSVAILGFSAPCFAQAQKPEWCKNLPRPEYKTLQRVLPDEAWFEVYKVAPATFAIYEPHQSEEVISYLMVGTKQALLFDTGMGIANIKALVARLTSHPIVVLNSHTHDDHVGGNWQFPFIYGMDTAYTRASATGSREDAQAEIAMDQICGTLPKNFDPAKYSTKPWKISLFVHNGFKVNLGGRTIEIIAAPGHTPDSISLIDRTNGLLFSGDTFYPGEIWLYRPETDLPAYLASVKKLVALAPEIKLVLGAHNVPVAQPSVLSQLDAAIRSVLAGKVQPKSVTGDQAIYQVAEISFRMRNPLPAVNSNPGPN